MKLFIALTIALAMMSPAYAVGEAGADTPGKLTDNVNPFLGTATLWNKSDLHYVRKRQSRTWGAETFPGAALPNAMIQCSPVTMFRSGSGYQYEDSLIYGFSHTNKGHWNLLHLPVLPAVGDIDPDDYASPFSHGRESARPGYYSVFLDRYGVEAELTTTLRCAFHRYTYPEDADKEVIVDITRNNNRVTDWDIRTCGENAFCGHQDGSGTIYFYVLANYPVESLELKTGDGRRPHTVAVVSFRDSRGEKPLELRFGFSFTSVENAKANLEAEMKVKSFEQVRDDADNVWENLLSAIKVDGGTERQRGLFYSCLYRAFMWPCLRSDVNGDHTDVQGNIVNTDYDYYTLPSFWDDYRNKLILLGMVRPDVASDVAASIIEMGEKGTGYMPTFFHGDHAAAFIAGTWSRGITGGYDIKRAYNLLYRNATVPGEGGRRYLDEYLEKGWIAEKDTVNVPYYDEYKGAVTKTLEYAYDDYAVAQVAKAVGDKEGYKLMMKHSRNWKNVFDRSTGFFRGRIADGSWIKDFDPFYPYFQYMYRESNAWNNLFYPPHDLKGMIGLYPSKKAIETKLDSLFTEPWRGYEVENLTGFLGNYCHGNQPGHSIPYMYALIGKQDKTQAVLNYIMDNFYDMGSDGLALAGMDDAGEMTSWYVLNAIGIYTYSPADPEYFVSVPLFDKTEFRLGDGRTFTIRRNGTGRHIESVLCGGKKLKGWFVGHDQLAAGGLVVNVR